MDPFRLLVLKPSSLGDIILGLQVIAELRMRRTDLEISWIVRDIFAEVVRRSGLVENIIVYERQKGLGGLWECCRAIARSGTYDALWDLQGLLRSALMAKAAHTQRKIGRSDCREGAKFFYSERVPMPANPHAAEILAQFLPTLGVPPAVRRPLQFSVPEPLSVAVDGQLRVLIAPESRGPGKEWPHYGQLTAHLCDRFPDWEFLWVGLGRGSSPLVEKFSNFRDLRGQTSLPQLLGLMKHSSAAIANDSACLHMAAALGKPVLGIFLRTDPLRYGPYPLDDPNHFVARNPPPLPPELEKFLSRLRFFSSREATS
ncbi:MAG: glycosyltransferase family 9 protein [Puniceicoccales bacterium]|nr:glycosyltransferase family 9 protein [Puniceicoccales bacterium]